MLYSVLQLREVALRKTGAARVRRFGHCAGRAIWCIIVCREAKAVSAQMRVQLKRNNPGASVVFKNCSILGPTRPCESRLAPPLSSKPYHPAAA